MDYTIGARLAYQHKSYRIATKGRVQRYRAYEQRHRVAGGSRQKQCTTCSRWKAEAEFYKNRSSRDGLVNRCKKCADKTANECRRWRRKNQPQADQPRSGPTQNLFHTITYLSFRFYVILFGKFADASRTRESRLAGSMVYSLATTYIYRKN
jgi:hypothetical protein